MTMFGGPQWGIFDQSGNALLEANSVLGVEYARDYQVSDYPQEQGAFESYNKVKVPFQAKVVFLIGTDIDYRSNFLNALEQAVSSLDLVTVVTPEISYPSANLTHAGYRRVARNGVTLIAIDVGLVEVRVVQAGVTSNVKSVNAVAQQNNGVVQAQPTTATPTTTGGTSESSNLVTGLAAPNGGGASSSLVSPNIGPAFYDANNSPQVPSAFGQLTSEQQQTVIEQGQQSGADAVEVAPADPSSGPASGSTDPNSNAVMQFRFSDKPLSIFQD